MIANVLGSAAQERNRGEPGSEQRHRGRFRNAVSRGDRIFERSEFVQPVVVGAAAGSAVALAATTSRRLPAERRSRAGSAPRRAKPCRKD